jgi:hypothetical protein
MNGSLKTEMFTELKPLASKFQSHHRNEQQCFAKEFVHTIYNVTTASKPSSLCVQTGCGAHPTSCKMGLSSWVKSSRNVLLTPHPIQCRDQERVEVTPRLTPSTIVTYSGTLLVLLHHNSRSVPQGYSMKSKRTCEAWHAVPGWKTWA